MYSHHPPGTRETDQLADLLPQDDQISLDPRTAAAVLSVIDELGIELPDAPELARTILGQVSGDLETSPDTIFSSNPEDPVYSVRKSELVSVLTRFALIVEAVTFEKTFAAIRGKGPDSRDKKRDAA